MKISANKYLARQTGPRDEILTAVQDLIEDMIDDPTAVKPFAVTMSKNGQQWSLWTPSPRPPEEEE